MTNRIASRVREIFSRNQFRTLNSSVRRRKTKSTPTFESLEARVLLSATAGSVNIETGLPELTSDELDGVTQQLVSATEEVAEALNLVLDGLTSTLETSFSGLSIPVISDQLEQILDPVIETLDTTIAKVPDVVEDILEFSADATQDPLGTLQGAFYMLMGPGQSGLSDLSQDVQDVFNSSATGIGLVAAIDAIHLGLLQDGSDLGDDVNPSDILISSGDHGPDSPIDVNWVQANFHLGQVLTIDLPRFDLELEELAEDVASLEDFLKTFNFEVNTTADLTTVMRWDLRTGFGIRESIDKTPRSEKVYIDSGATLSGLATGDGVEEFKATISVYADVANKAATFGDASGDDAVTTENLQAEISLGLFEARITDGTPTDVKVTAAKPLDFKNSPNSTLGSDITITIEYADGVREIVLENPPSPTATIADFLIPLNAMLIEEFAEDGARGTSLIPDIAFTLGFSSVNNNTNPDVETTPTLVLSSHAANINNLTIAGAEAYGFQSVQYEDARGKSLGFGSGIVMGENGQPVNSLVADLAIPADGVAIERPDLDLWVIDDRDDESTWTKVSISESLSGVTGPLDDTQARLARLNLFETPEEYVQALEDLIQLRIATATGFDAESVTLELNSENKLVLTSHAIGVMAAPQLALSYTSVDRTKLTLTGAVDITDPNYDESIFFANPDAERTFNRLTLKEIKDSDNKSDVFDPILKGEANVRLHVKTHGLAGGPQSLGIINDSVELPGLSFDLIVDASIDLSDKLKGKKKSTSDETNSSGSTGSGSDTTNNDTTESQKKKVYKIDAFQFDNLTVDVGDLTKLVEPILEATDVVLDPIFSIFGATEGASSLITERIPVISDLLDKKVSIASLVDSISPAGDDLSLEEILETLYSFSDEADDLIATLRDLDTISLGGWELVLDPESPLYFPTTNLPIPIALSEALDTTDEAGDFLYKDLPGLAALKEGFGLRIDLLLPSNVISNFVNITTGNFFGGSFDIISYGLPAINFSPEIGFNFGWGDDLSFKGDVEGEVQAIVRVGYDSVGLQRIAQQILNDVDPDWSAIADGLGIFTASGNRPEVQIKVNGSASANVDAVIISGSGSIKAEAELELDILDPDHDGKLRLDEIADQTNDFNDLEHLFCLFQLDASASVKASGKVEIDYGFGTETVFSVSDFGFSTGDIDFKNLVSSKFVDCDDLPNRNSILATPVVIDGENVLRLNAGPYAYKRLYGDTDDSNGGIRFTVTEGKTINGLTELIVEATAEHVDRAGNIREEYLGSKLYIGNFDKILGIGGPNDDTFNLELVETIPVEIRGGDGNDDLRGGDQSNLLLGERGNDSFQLGPGDDAIFTGSDNIGNQNSAFTYRQLGGTDLIDFSGNAAAITFENYNAGSGSATIIGTDFDDSISVTNTVRVEGGLGDDKLTGKQGNQHLLGQEGNDTLIGGQDSDLLEGGIGNDRLYANEQTLTASVPGNDQLFGGDGADLLVGGPGNDSINGGAGADLVIVGSGSDSLTGGQGEDALEILLEEQLNNQGNPIKHLATLTNTTLNGSAGSTTYSGFETIGVEFKGETDFTIDGVLTPFQSVVSTERIVGIIGSDKTDSVTIKNLPSESLLLVDLSLGDDTLTITDVTNTLFVEYDAGSNSGGTPGRDKLVYDRSADPISRSVTVTETRISHPILGEIDWSDEAGISTVEIIETKFGTGEDRISLQLEDQSVFNLASEFIVSGGSGADLFTIDSEIPLTIKGDSGDDRFIMKSIKLDGDALTTQVEGGPGSNKVEIVLPGNPVADQFNGLDFDDIIQLVIDNSTNTDGVKWRRERNEVSFLSSADSLETFLNDVSGVDEVYFKGGTSTTDELTVQDTSSVSQEITIDQSSVQSVQGFNLLEELGNSTIEDGTGLLIEGIDETQVMASSPDGEYFYLARNQRILVVRKVNEGFQFVQELLQQTLPGTYNSALSDPNGIEVSQDGKYVYVTSSDSPIVIALRRLANGQLADVGLFADLTNNNTEEVQILATGPNGEFALGFTNTNLQDFVVPFKVQADETSLFLSASGVSVFDLDLVTGVAISDTKMVVVEKAKLDHFVYSNLTVFDFTTETVERAIVGDSDLNDVVAINSEEFVAVYNHSDLLPNNDPKIERGGIARITFQSDGTPRVQRFGPYKEWENFIPVKLEYDADDSRIVVLLDGKSSSNPRNWQVDQFTTFDHPTPPKTILKFETTGGSRPLLLTDPNSDSLFLHYRSFDQSIGGTGTLARFDTDPNQVETDPVEILQDGLPISLNRNAQEEQVQVVVTEDGTRLYALSTKFGALTAYDRDPHSGELTNPNTTLVNASPGASIFLVGQQRNFRTLYVYDPASSSLQSLIEETGLSNQVLIPTGIQFDGIAGAVSEASQGGMRLFNSTLYIPSSGDNAIHRFGNAFGGSQLSDNNAFTDANLSSPIALEVLAQESGKDLMYVLTSMGELLVYEVDTSAAPDALIFRESISVPGGTALTIGRTAEGNVRVFVAQSDSDSLLVFEESNGTLIELSSQKLVNNSSGVSGIDNVSELAFYTESDSNSSFLIAANSSGSVVVFEVQADQILQRQRERVAQSNVTGLQVTYFPSANAPKPTPRLFVSGGGQGNSPGGFTELELTSLADIDPTVYRTRFENVEAIEVNSGNGADTATVLNTPQDLTVHLAGGNDTLDLLSTNDNSKTTINGEAGRDNITVFSTGFDATTAINAGAGFDTISIRGKRLKSDVTVQGGDPPSPASDGDTLIFDLQDPAAKLEALPNDDNSSFLSEQIPGTNAKVEYQSIESVLEVAGPSADAGGPYVVSEGEMLDVDGSATFIPGGSTNVIYTWSINNIEFATGINPDPISLNDLGINDGPHDYQIILKVDSENSGNQFTDIATAVVKVQNVAPNPVLRPGTAEVGRPYQLDLSLEDPGDDTLEKWLVDWNVDDGVDETEEFFGRVSAVTHIFTEAGDFRVSVTAVDEDGTHIDTTQITTIRVEPARTISGPTRIDEGSEYVLELNQSVIAITSWTIDWGDGNATTQPGNATSATHTYRDHGHYEITVTSKDIDGGTSVIPVDTIAVDVRNVAPTIVGITAPMTVKQGESSETITVSATDPGPDDSLTYDFDIDGDGAFEVSGPGNSVTPLFKQVGPQTISVRVRDDDGGVSDVATFVVDVTNAAPLITAVEAAEANEGESTRVFVDAIDANGERLTYEFDFDNDGIYELTTLNGAALHTFPDDGVYRVNVRVSDENGETATSSVEVIVNNVAPSYSYPVITGPIVNEVQTSRIVEGQEFTLQITGTDPAGANDPLTYYFDLNNDGVYEVVNTIGIVTHSYPDDRVYEIPIQIHDDDGGVTEVRFSQLPLNTDGSVATQFVEVDGELVEQALPEIENALFQVFVFNDAPQIIEVNAPATVNQNAGPVTISVTATDLGIEDILTYGFDFDNDGTFEVSGPASTVQHEFTQIGINTFQIQVLDDDGGASEIVQVQIEVINLPPVIEQITFDVVDEINPTTVTVTATDPGNDDLTYEFDFDSDGVYEISLKENFATHEFGDSGVHPVGIRVVDEFGLSVESTIDVTVNNVAPTLTLVADASVDAPSSDRSIAVNGTVGDPGLLDTHYVQIDWGDGTTTTVNVDPVSRTYSAEYHYGQGGIFEIRAVAIDDDGGVSEEVSTTVALEGFGLVDGTLFIIGTDDRDHVHLNVNRRKDELRVHIILGQGKNRRKTSETYVASEVNNIVAFLRDGDDHYNGDGCGNAKKFDDTEIAFNQIIYAGAGNDHVTGGNWDDAIFGESGDDHIQSRSGNNILSGGIGKDKVKSGHGMDLVHGGFFEEIDGNLASLPITKEALHNWSTGDLDGTLNFLGTANDDLEIDKLFADEEDETVSFPGDQVRS